MSIGTLPTRHYDYKNPAGKLIICGVPKGAPPFFEAVLQLEKAVANNHEFIRLEYGGMKGKAAPRVVEYRVDEVYKQAKKLEIAWVSLRPGMARTACKGAFSAGRSQRHFPQRR
jgi:hypothetical protein